MSGRDTLYCSFCAKSQHQVRKLIAGPAVFICDECVDICRDIVTGNPHGPRQAVAADFGFGVKFHEPSTERGQS